MAQEETGREEFEEYVLERSMDGDGVREIVLSLKEMENPPAWLRKMKKAALARKVRAIIVRHTSDNRSGADEFDAQAKDDKRSWEMGYEDDPDAPESNGLASSDY